MATRKSLRLRRGRASRSACCPAGRKIFRAAAAAWATMMPMAGAYEQLLDATIQHLEDLKSRGVRYVAVSPETLRALAQPMAQKSQTSNSKSQVEKAAAPLPAGKPPIHSALRTPHSALPQPVAEQETLLALPGETVPASAAAGSTGEGRRVCRAARARAGLREMPAPRVVAQERRVRRRQH